MSLYLVEGLNCSGKTTFVDKVYLGTVLNTSYANPLRWDIDKKKLIPKRELYSVGVYESILRTFPKWPASIYWDRTFISSFVYGTINIKCFNYLVDTLLEFDPILYKIIYVDTCPKTCYERLMKLRKKNKKYKNYIWCDTLDKMEEVDNVLQNTLEYLNVKKGIPLQTIKGEGD